MQIPIKLLIERKSLLNKALKSFMKNEKTLAYINFYAILGAISELCRLDEKAASLVANKKISLGISVKDGPCGKLVFDNGTCTLKKDVKNVDIKLPFSSCEKFNGMIDGTVTPIPSKGFTKIGFLLKTFMPLTDILSKYLRPSEEDLKNPEFFKINTYLTFYVVSEAISQIANTDPIGQVSASYIVDGTVKLAIGDELCANIKAENHILTTSHEKPDNFLSYMIFENIELANNLFNNRVNSVACVGLGKIKIGGMISQVDNINRILDRVSLYLA